MALLKYGGNYAYACARVRAKKSFLLADEVYPRMLNMDLHEIGRFLGETQYREEITALGARYAGVDLIENGSAKNLANTYASVLGFTRGHLRELITLYLRRWDHFNLKTVLRAKTTAVPLEELAGDLVPAGAFSEEYFRGLAAMASLQEVLEAVSVHPQFAIPLEFAREVAASGRVAPLEDWLDKRYYEQLLEVIRPTARAERLFLEFVRREIDVANLKVLLKLKAAGFAPEKIYPYLIAGGEEFPLRRLREMAGANGIRRVTDELLSSSYAEGVKGPLERLEQAGTVSEVTLALDRGLLRTAEKFSHLYPLSILPILDYLIRKKVEVDNIRIIARGKERGLSSEVIRSLLVV